jgi:hypothetical protein
MWGKKGRFGRVWRKISCQMWEEKGRFGRVWEKNKQSNHIKFVSLWQIIKV